LVAVLILHIFLILQVFIRCLNISAPHIALMGTCGIDILRRMSSSRGNPTDTYVQRCAGSAKIYNSNDCCEIG